MVCCCYAGDQLCTISHGTGLQQIPGQGSSSKPDPPASSGTFPESVALCPAAICSPTTDRDLLQEVFVTSPWAIV